MRNIYNSLNLQGYPDLVVLADMSPFMTLLIAEVRVMYTVMILDIYVGRIAWIRTIHGWNCAKRGSMLRADNP